MRKTWLFGPLSWRGNFGYQAKMFGGYTVDSGELWKGFKQGRDMVNFVYRC